MLGLIKTRLEKWLASLLLVFLLSSPLAGKLLWDKAVLEGIKSYHFQCYYVGGFIIDEEGHAVVCQKLTSIPKEEMEKYAGKQI